MGPGGGAAMTPPGGAPTPTERVGAIADDLRQHDFCRRKITSRNPRIGTGSGTFQDEDSNHRLAVSQSGRGVLRFLLRAHRDVAEPTAGFHLFDRLGNLVFATGTWQQRATIPPMRAGEDGSLPFAYGSICRRVSTP